MEHELGKMNSCAAGRRRPSTTAQSHGPRVKILGTRSNLLHFSNREGIISFPSHILGSTRVSSLHLKAAVLFRHISSSTTNVVSHRRLRNLGRDDNTMGKQGMVSTFFLLASSVGVSLKHPLQSLDEPTGPLLGGLGISTVVVRRHGQQSPHPRGKLTILFGDGKH